MTDKTPITSATRGQARPSRLDLSGFDKKRVALLLSCQGEPKAFCATAVYQTDETLGSVLRLRIDDPEADAESAELLISETDWDGEIVDGHRFGCDACFIPSPRWPPG